MAPSNRLSNPQMYTVGWIVALDKELARAKAILDEKHQKPEGFKKRPKDNNNYAWGSIGEHNIVIASLAAGRYGTVSAATTACSMISSLQHLRFGLMVGIGAGIPRLEENIDIRLRDIVVSQPTGTSPGVVQYDLGKIRSRGKVERVGSLDALPEVLLKGLASLKANHLMEESRVPKILEAMIRRYPKMGEPGMGGATGFVYQGVHSNRLFEAPSIHHNPASDGDAALTSFIPPKELKRKNRKSTNPMIHYGIIVSGNSVINDGVSRDEILQSLDDKCICFEMEAAGLLNNFPCLVIRGVCDYADEHKSDQWQNYAAATAAAFAKELLEVMDGEDVERASPIEKTLKER
ncbi:hypothetical protein GTA08_BOTSDO13133 [Botryosphaeria dothidea]|uniref:Nucleoside phosphorylase domain-containing protein n=1 Tax=Botryosphaeria dothidea TaxID=55169 RepID=A0A8H4J194_9PEZI|nr:hypothetical protein GTA08_BOTSDO13133 [Botryosphaeria dothidea]